MAVIQVDASCAAMDGVKAYRPMRSATRHVQQSLIDHRVTVIRHVGNVTPNKLRTCNTTRHIFRFTLTSYPVALGLQLLDAFLSARVH